MYPIPPTETLVEMKTCRHCDVSFPITDKDLEFYEKVSPVFNGQKYQIPTPTLCPDCRQQRRLSFRNERKLYKRKCDATGRDIISIYSPDKPFKVYHQDFWWSDKWDPMEYGRGFDFTRGFFEQFGELINSVPKNSIVNVNIENSEYCSEGSELKQSYLCFSVTASENTLYSNTCNRIKSSVDLSNCVYCEESYNLIECTNILKGYYSLRCERCTNIQYCIDCVNCENCFGCVNLRDKKYHFLNESLSKEEYELRVSQSKNDMESFFVLYEELITTLPKKFANLNMCENVVGNFLYQCKNVQNCFDSFYLESSKYIQLSGRGNNNYDISILRPNTEWSLEGLRISGFNVLFSLSNIECQNNIYCDNCYNSSQLFGCIGLRNKSYCIFNKQYTKEEYEILVPKIIEHMMKTGEWGEFFPSSLSPFGYNETVAMEYYPLERRDVLTKRLYNWSDYEAPFPRVEKIIPAAKLPEDIAKIPDDILNWAIECEVTGKPFRIIRQELEFYRKHNLPIPRRHPDQRHLDRMNLRNPRKLYNRKCDECGVEMMTTYAPCDSLEVPLGCSPERPEVVYCEGCYNKEVIG